MKFVRDPLNEVTIRQVERGSILIGEDTYKSTVGVTVDEIVSEGLPSAIDELNAESLAPLLEAKPEMLVVGCGWASTLPPSTTWYPREGGRPRCLSSTDWSPGDGGRPRRHLLDERARAINRGRLLRKFLRVPSLSAGSRALRAGFDARARV